MGTGKDHLALNTFKNMLRQDAFAAQLLFGAEPIFFMVPVLEAAFGPVPVREHVQSVRAKFRFPSHLTE